MNAALISGFIIGLAGVITQNAGSYWHSRRLGWLAGALEIGAGLLLGWGARMAHRDIFTVVLAACIVLSVAGSLAFVGFMAEVKHQGWMPVVKRMGGRGHRP